MCDHDYHKFQPKLIPSTYRYIYIIFQQFQIQRNQTWRFQRAPHSFFSAPRERVPSPARSMWCGVDRGHNSWGADLGHCCGVDRCWRRWWMVRGLEKPFGDYLQQFQERGSRLWTETPVFQFFLGQKRSTYHHLDFPWQFPGTMAWFGTRNKMPRSLVSLGAEGFSWVANVFFFVFN